MNPENYCIHRRDRLLGQAIKQPLNNFESWKPWNYKQLLGLRPDQCCLWKKIHVFRDVIQENLWSKDIFLIKARLLDTALSSNESFSGDQSPSENWIASELKPLRHLSKNKYYH